MVVHTAFITSRIAFRISVTLVLMVVHTVVITERIPDRMNLILARKKSKIVMMMVFRPSSTDCTLSLIASHAELMTFLIAVITVVMTVFTLLIAVSIFSLIASHASMTTSLQFSQMNWNGNVMIVTAALIISRIAMNATVMMFLMVSNTFETTSLHFANTSENAVCTAVSFSVTAVFTSSSLLANCSFISVSLPPVRLSTKANPAV